MHDELLKTNKEQYQKAGISSLASKPWRTELKNGASEHADRILEGKDSIPDNTPLGIRRWLTNMRRCDGVKPFPFKITDEEITDKIKYIKEIKGSSPSGRHTGYYKAALYDEQILQAHINMIIIAVEHNLTP